MDMKLNTALIRQEREKRAWSQEHLAQVTGLALRTIQRIESTGSASYESASAIAAMIGLPVADLRGTDLAATAPTPGMQPWFTWHRLVTLLGCTVLAAVFTPPAWRATLPVAVAFWLGCELAIKTRRTTLPVDRR